MNRASWWHSVIIITMCIYAVLGYLFDVIERPQWSTNLFIKGGIGLFAISQCSYCC